MCCGSYRTLCLFVGWLNIVASVLVSIYHIHRWLTSMQKLDVYYAKSLESDEVEENDYEPTLLTGLIQESMMYLALAVLLFFVPSILLVKGIKQNCPKLVAVWLYVTYFSMALNALFVIYMCWIVTSYFGSFAAGIYSSVPLSGGLVYLLLCLYPVRKWYTIMSIPPTVLPTHCYMENTKPEDHHRCMPVFDN